MRTRPQTSGEEIANAASHGIGLLASLAALPLLVVWAVRRHDPWQVVAGSVFGAMLLLLYAASVLYHAMPPATRAKRVFRVLDHSAIYLLIAGTYTPFALGALRGPWGWSLLGTIWGLAILGIALKAGAGVRHRGVSTAVYVGMGWLVLVAAGPLVHALGPRGIGWLLAGGLCYTVGVVAYARPQVRYAHFVWHLFVLAGSGCHFWAVAAFASGAGR